MSIIVKNLTMPTECRECYFMKYYPVTGRTWCEVCEGGLLADDRKAIPFDGRPKWCPLVELPENHGDLIDRAEIFEMMKHAPHAFRFFTEGDYVDVRVMDDILCSVNVLFEAEESEC